MHKVKSQARQSAWIREEGGQFNPFGKYPARKDSRTGSRTNSLDPEKALGPIVTNGATSTRGIAEPDVSPIAERESSSGELNGTGPTSSAASPASDTPIHPTMRQRLNGIIHPKHKDKEGGGELERTKSGKPTKKFTIWGQLRATVFGSWVNILLICVPVGIALNYTKGIQGVVIFVVNFLAIIPLAGLLSYATEEIALRVGETLGGLLNASFGNAVELIVSILALAKDEILIVQTSLIGSMLSNLLLVLGMCFFFGGLKRTHQNFNVTVAQTASSLLALAIGSLIIPTTFVKWGEGTAADDTTRMNNVASLSRGVAVILLIVYFCYLFFQLKTHADMYNEGSEKVAKRPDSGKPNIVRRGLTKVGVGAGAHAAGGPFEGDNLRVAPNSEAEANNTEGASEGDDEREEPNLSLIGAIVTLCVSTALVGVCAEFMVDGIASVTKPPSGISAEFVGLILIPIVGNAAEHATAVTVAVKDKMDLAIGVAVGSSMQIALLILPLTVVIGWGLGKPDMNLNFDGFLLAMLFISIILVNYLIADGRSHWLEGVLLMSTYIIIAVAAYFYPVEGNVVG